jgi:thiamine pyrophosphokinase
VQAVIFVNGTLPHPQAVSKMLKPGDLLIAADGGARLLEAMGRRPDILVGDLDSIDPNLLRDYERRGVRVERHPVQKDQSDLELALDVALARKPDSIKIVGVLGGRMDHTLANILILAQRKWPVEVWLADGLQLATLLRGPTDAIFAVPPGRIFSMIPLSSAVEGITYHGLEYPLQNETLTLGSTRGLSNRAVQPVVRVTVENGLLMIVMQPAPGTGTVEP